MLLPETQLGRPGPCSCNAPPRVASRSLQLEAYRRFNEEAALRDHRRLGQELDLFRWPAAGAMLVQCCVLLS